MSERSEKIDAIIASRQPIAEKTGKAVTRLNSVQAALQSCSTKLQEFLDKGIQSEQTDKAIPIQKQLQDVLNNEIPARVRELHQIRERFTRPTLNVGIVGNAGQGKSTFLQQLTGLADDEIPTGGKGDCTGAAAIIENKNINEAYADIEFYSEKEFLENVVAPYYKVFGLTIPSTLSEFSVALPDEVGKTHYDETEFLKRLQNGLEKYRPFLGERQKRISRNQIREYTAKSDKNGTFLTTWAAVKSARVYCRFPGLENEKISVGDTPGLGDRVVVEAEERLMQDFGRNIDSVIMLRKVKERGVRKGDIELYNLIKKAIPELPVEDWAYFIVNVFAFDNELQKDSLNWLPEDIKQSSLKGLRYLAINCSQRNEVLSSFDRILNDIANGQHKLDETLYNERAKHVESLLTDIKTLVGEMQVLFPLKSADTAGIFSAINLFQKNIWGKLPSKLNLMLQQRKDNRDKDNEEFSARLDTLENLLVAGNFLPTPDDIQMQAATGGLLACHSQECRRLRRYIIDEFDSLDEIFAKLFDNLRTEARQCLEDEDGGKLGNIPFPTNNDQSWWNWLADEITLLGQEGQDDEDKQAFLAVAKALRLFNDASLSFRGFMLPRLMSFLDVLDTDSPKHAPFAPKSGETLEQLLDKLRSAVKQAVRLSCEEVRQIAKEVSIALFLAIEALRDGAISLSSQNVWAQYYADHRGYIWKEKFQVVEQDITFRREWQQAVETVKKTL
ncbi:MAG: hypothetical protein LBK06_07435 [Planctomycetaceae bacterium]|jgi:energy-coupling factor transporter ATP-binding protein EcfA2|nr:hypothetical protein [Planctomycetaceae bacterium]